MVGWTVCSLFASVAFNWTFYYVSRCAVAGREIADQPAAPRRARATEAAPMRKPVGALVRRTRADRGGSSSTPARQ